MYCQRRLHNQQHHPRRRRLQRANGQAAHNVGPPNAVEPGLVRVSSALLRRQVFLERRYFYHGRRDAGYKCYLVAYNSGDGDCCQYNFRAGHRNNSSDKDQILEIAHRCSRRFSQASPTTTANSGTWNSCEDRGPGKSHYRGSSTKIPSAASANSKILIVPRLVEICRQTPSH